MAAKRRYHCVAVVHRGRVSGWLSCSTSAQRAAAHLAALRDSGMTDIEIVSRASKPAGVKAPPKGRRPTQGSLFARRKAGQQELFGKIQFGSKKVTPNQLAKMAVMDKGSLWQYFMEGHQVWDQMTEREQIAFSEAGDRQFARVEKLLDPKGELDWWKW